MSEIAIFRQQIENEIAAMRQALYGYAVVSSHEIINHHLGNISDILEGQPDEIKQPLVIVMLEELEKNDMNQEEQKEEIVSANVQKEIAITDALELIDPHLYQLYVRRAAHNHYWADYFLLINTCCEIAKQAPTTLEACDQADMDKLMIYALERLGKLVKDILPDGADELKAYMPQER